MTYKNFSAYANATEHICVHCQSRNTIRKIGRVAIAKGEAARLDALTDESVLAAIDENDPASMGQFMKKMSQEVGGELGSDFDEVTDQLKSGQISSSDESKPTDPK
ncbi:MAG: hypothetical protein AAGD96_21070 [Chloroflexota bacterium]